VEGLLAETKQVRGNSVVKLLGVIGVLGFIFLLIFLLEKRDADFNEAPHKPKSKDRSQRLLLARILVRCRMPFRILSAVAGTAIAVFGALYAVWGPFWPTDPQIHASGPDFSLPFTVTNSNNWFDIYSMQLFCVLGKTTPADPREGVASNNLFKFTDNRGIPHGWKHSYSCEVATPGYKVKQAEMLIVVEYLTSANGIQIGGQRNAGESFHWQYGQWVEGPLN
jgi:hypothetical protein